MPLADGWPGPHSSAPPWMHRNDTTGFVCNDGVDVGGHPSIPFRLPADYVIGLAHTSTSAVILPYSGEVVGVLGQLIQVLILIEDALCFVHASAAGHMVLLDIRLASAVQ